ncbi:MAG: hypothetical protein K2N05_06570 [Muribaculaceae bacterium]|nr:hypothetical protein [Muribaculaceae bacterium]
MWTFLFFIAFGSFAARQSKGSKKTGSFDSPDFAFPTEVSATARGELKKALNENKSVRALQAVMQIVIAEDLVSDSNVQKGLDLIDSVSKLLPEPYASLGCLLQARVYNDIYNANRWVYNQRSIPMNPVPEDVKEWSRDIFSRKVVELVEKSRKGFDAARLSSVEIIAPLITNAEQAKDQGLTVYDFMTIRGINSLTPFSGSGANNTIPFFEAGAKGNRTTELDASAMVKKLLSENLEWHSKKGASRSGAFMEFFSLGFQDEEDDNGKKRIKQLIETYKDTPWCVPFIMTGRNYVSPSDIDSYRKLYKFSSDYLGRFPEAIDAKGLKGMLTNMMAESVEISAAAQIIPGRETEGLVTSSNLGEFYILALKLGEDALKKNPTEASLTIGSKPAASVKISVKGEETDLPFSDESKFKLPALESGVYALVASRTADRTGIIRNVNERSTVPVMLVSRLSYFTTAGKNGGKDSSWLFITEGSNGAPVEGAMVKFTPAWDSRDWKESTAKTDKEGKVQIPSGSYNFSASLKKDFITGYAYTERYDRNTSRETEGQLFTSLSIYRPGDKISFSGVAYSRKGVELQMAPDREVSIVLRDANYQACDTLNVKTDKFGRLNGEFTLPSDGLLGSWSLVLMDGSNSIGHVSFEVAEYKAPTFYVAADTDGDENYKGEVIRISGEVRTYSGIPMADAEVKYDIKYQPCYWIRYSAGGNASYGGTLKTDSKGKFEIDLPTSNLKGTRYALGNYRLNITATNSAGETQTANPLSFSIGEAFRIIPKFREKIEIGNKEEMTASAGVYDMLDRPVKKTIYYKLESMPDSVVKARGDFEAGRFPIDFSSLASGEYRVIFSLNQEFKDTQNEPNTDVHFIVWRRSDKKPPVATSLWVPESRIIVPSDSGEKVEVKVGSSYADSRIFAMFSDSEGVYDSKWLSVSNGIVEVPVKVPGEMGRTKVFFAATHDLESITTDVTLIPEIQTKGVEIKAETFRDRITPGGSEEWKFVFTFSDKKLAGIPVMAVMSNKALNALAPFNWAFNPYGSLYWSVPGRIGMKYSGITSWSYRPGKVASESISHPDMPDWNTYGQSLYGYGRLGGIHIRGAYAGAPVKNMALKSTSSAKEESAEEEVAVAADMVSNEMKVMATVDSSGVLEEPAMIVEGNGGSNSQSSDEGESLREIDCPLAFFMSVLLTDSEGTASLDFEVPDFNGTWQLQVMGYTSDLRGAVIKKDAISSKPVMAQLNAPRFVRTGDQIVVKGTIFNNTDDAAPISGLIELFNPTDGKVIASSESTVEYVDAMGSRTISVEFIVPSDLNMLGVRIYGKGKSSKDGEQTIVPVYPSSTPVIEGVPFWIAPGEKSFSMSIPKERDNGVTTLSYTDNPIWECVTALPAMMNPDSENVLAKSNALYSTALVAGLLDKYPSLSRALKIFADPVNSPDSTLISNLEKNSSLKAVSLNNTPWVMDAKSQTLRMASLTDYTDESKSRKAIEDIVGGLLKLQNKDGGWSWCDGTPSSEWITMQVIERLSMLHSAGFLPAKCENAARKGMSYIDSEIVKEWKKTGASKYSYIGLLEYLYIRSNWKNVSTSGDFSRIKKRAIEDISKEWKSMDIYDKATAAMLLNRENEKSVARLVMESLSQYASHSKEKGMWYDNLPSGFRGRGKLLTTAQVLSALHEISPSAPEVNQLRQWILMSKQVEDWGDGSIAAQLVNAILSTGTDWTVTSSAPEILINGERIEVDNIARLTGSLTVSLTGKSGELKITRDAVGPAWGGIVSQYVSPIADVKEMKTPQLSVTKNLYVITNDKDGTTASSASLKVGDRVRVTITLKCDRDLQYVALIDNRSACLEPADQISGYTSSDGVWMYREVRNTATNLFIPFLSKGTHVISYDCFVDREGEYSLGIATAQSQYAPVITSHSAGKVIVVK